MAGVGEKDKAMEGRLGHLEQTVAGLKSEFSTFGKVLEHVTSSQEEMRKDQADIKNTLIALTAKQPAPVKDMLTVVATTATILSGVFAALFFLVDARVGVKAEPAIHFAEQLTNGGRYYLLEERVKRLESAMGWKASIVP